MLNAAEQLAKYKEEKAYVCQGDPLDEANFPSFKQWRVDYVREYQEAHQTVDVALADRMMEAVQAEADSELEIAFETALEAELEDQEEYDEMTDETTTTEIVTDRNGNVTSRIGAGRP